MRSFQVLFTENWFLVSNDVSAVWLEGWGWRRFCWCHRLVWTFSRHCSFWLCLNTGLDIWIFNDCFRLLELLYFWALYRMQVYFKDFPGLCGSAGRSSRTTPCCDSHMPWTFWVYGHCLDACHPPITTFLTTKKEATDPMEGEVSLSWVPAVTFLMMTSQTNCIALFTTGLGGPSNKWTETVSIFLSVEQMRNKWPFHMSAPGSRCPLRLAHLWPQVGAFLVTEWLEPICRVTLLHMHKGTGKFSSHYFISHLFGVVIHFFKCTIGIIAKGARWSAFFGRPVQEC